MVFSSLFFLFFFLTLCYGLYLFMPSLKAKNVLLLVFSLIFYAWAGPVYVGLLCSMTFICWAGARLMPPLCRLTPAEAPDDRTDALDKRYARIRKAVMWVTVGACLVLLCAFKYTDFAVRNVQTLFGLEPKLPGVVLPIGISFYTFQLLSYVVDVYRGRVPAQKRYDQLLLYAALFHQCVAGPIVRYADIQREITDRRASVNDVFEGLSRFTVGVAKKAILTNACGRIADTLLPLSGEGYGQLSALSVLLGMAAYMLEIYLDFSAYSDMAIGMGRMVGFHFRENFNYPYTAVSVTDFWRRWHISLSSFFRDYVYIPLGGNRCTKGRQIFNLLVVWGLTGLWHGASWNYVLWGLYFCLFLILEKFVFRWQADCTGLKRHLHRLYTLVVVYFGWFLFRFEDLSLLGKALAALFGFGSGFADKLAVTTLVNNLFILTLCVLACTPIIPALRDRLTRARKGSGLSAGFASVVGNCAAVLLPVTLLILSALALVGNQYNPFMYTRF